MLLEVACESVGKNTEDDEKETEERSAFGGAFRITQKKQNEPQDKSTVAQEFWAAHFFAEKDRDNHYRNQLL